MSAHDRAVTVVGHAVPATFEDEVRAEQREAQERARAAQQRQHARQILQQTAATELFSVCAAAVEALSANAAAQEASSERTEHGFREWRAPTVEGFRTV